MNLHQKIDAAIDAGRGVMVSPAKLAALLNSIDDCVKQQGCGYDVLASAAWDDVQRAWRALVNEAVRDTPGGGG